MPDHGVITIGGGIHAPIVEIEYQLDPGVLSEKRKDSRAEMHSAKRDGSGDAHWADQSAAPLGHVPGCLVDLICDARSSLEEGGPVLRQGQLACAATHEARAEASLEFGQSVAHHRRSSLSDPASATVTKVVTPSSLIIFRIFRNPVAPFAD
jgi:hypothetical protein